MFGILQKVDGLETHGAGPFKISWEGRGSGRRSREKSIIVCSVEE